MADTEKIKAIFLRALNVPNENYRADLKLGDIPQWDSLAHLNLMFALEDAFGVQFAADSIPKLKTLPMISAELDRLAKVG
jgi:acyl carrier protein